MGNIIQVLIVDDSALVRRTLAEVLSSDPCIRIMDTASDPYVAARKMQVQKPDVIILDIEMPRMDGITFLKKLMSQHPIPVVICSSLAIENSDAVFKALQYGAIEIITKPLLGTRQFLEEARISLCDRVKAAAMARPKKITAPLPVTPKFNADVILPISHRAILKTTEKVVAVGASTGGTEALRVFLEAFPTDGPGIVIVQHMPENFTKTFADRLNSTCRIMVKEAAQNDTVLPGRALIAPGNQHVLLKCSGTRYYVDVREGPLVSRHRPSVNVLFRSAARYAGKNAIGVIMTGMGDDGAQGILEMKESGAYTLAQDEGSCVVFGMPKKAIELGGIDRVLPLEKLADAVIKHTNG